MPTVSIISEGIEDQGVLKNIFRAFGFDGSEVLPIRPALSLDATDRHCDTQTIGTFQGVKNACIGKNGKRPDFERALANQDCCLVVIQIDTAEIEQQSLNVKRPSGNKDQQYFTSLRNQTIALINSWLGYNYVGKIAYAITVEEIEAWCLTMFEERETGNSTDPKARWELVAAKHNLSPKHLRIPPAAVKSMYFEEATRRLKGKKFNRLKDLKKLAEHNQSLKEFVGFLERRL